MNHQTVGNIGLYYVCYRLSRLGWNVMPTSRNARGVDIVAYNQDATATITVQVKALSKRNPVGLGKNLATLIADFLVVCRHIQKDKPECFILARGEVVERAVAFGVGSKQAYWLDPPKYEAPEFLEKWERIIAPLS